MRARPQRAKKPPAGFDRARDRQFQAALSYFPTDKSTDANPSPCSIEPWTQRAQKLRFPRQRCRFVLALLQLDSGDGAQQFQMPVAQPFGIGHPITTEPPAQIPGFADIEDIIGLVTHEINARALRRVTEELQSQPI